MQKYIVSTPDNKSFTITLHPQVTMCSPCGGHGSVVSGSTHPTSPGQSTTVCQICRGSGRVGNMDAALLELLVLRDPTGLVK